MIKKLSIALFVIAVAVVLYYFYGSPEVETDVSFDKEFISPERYCKEAGKELQTYSFGPAQVQQLQDKLNSLEECTEISLKEGRFKLDRSMTIAGVKGLIIKGSGIDKTILDFQRKGNGNGIDGESVRHLRLMNFTVIDSAKNGIEVRQSEHLVIENTKATWSVTSGPEKGTNGAYGYYPVNVSNVLLDEVEAYYASDAGIYVGQCVNAIVKNSRAFYNVMGLEIENTVNADVYNNIAEKNTGGMLFYDLNTNTIVSRNVRFYNNRMVNNNTENFSRAGIVQSVPAGVGFIITAAREIEIYDNIFSDNNTTDIAIMSGLVTETPDFDKWEQNNFRAHSIYIHDNTFNGNSGYTIDNNNYDVENRPLGALLGELYEIIGEHSSEFSESKEVYQNILYDGVDDGQTIFALTNTFLGNNHGNYNDICLQNNNKGKVQPLLLDLNMPALLNNSETPTVASMTTAVKEGDLRFYRPDNYKSFSCEGFRAAGVPVKGLADADIN